MNGFIFSLLHYTGKYSEYNPRQYSQVCVHCGRHYNNSDIGYSVGCGHTWKCPNCGTTQS